MADQQIQLKPLSKLLGITERRIQQLAKEGVVHAADTRGEYLFFRSVNGYISYLQDIVTSKPEEEMDDEDKEEYKKARLRKLKLEGDKLEFEKVVREKEWDHKDNYQSVYEERLQVYRTAVDDVVKLLKGLVPDLTASHSEQMDNIVIKAFNSLVDQ